MQVPQKREAFLAGMTEMMEEVPFTLFLTVIRKQAHQDRYGIFAENPYDLALVYTFERVVKFLEGEGETVLPVTAEARGAKEDGELEAAFFRMFSNGTQYVKVDRFRRLNCPLTFRPKRDNVAGMQLADLCAHPAARHVLKPEQHNQAFEVVKKHIYDRGGTRGWKVFP